MHTPIAARHTRVGIRASAALFAAAPSLGDFGCEDRGCLVLHRRSRADGRVVGERPAPWYVQARRLIRFGRITPFFNVFTLAASDGQIAGAPIGQLISACRIVVVDSGSLGRS
jgi:hypothetical protein